MKTVTLLYFGLLKQQRGLGEESIKTDAANVGFLYEIIAQNHHLSLKVSEVKFARNEAFCTADEPLKDNDVIAFLPPMAGG